MNRSINWRLAIKVTMAAFFSLVANALFFHLFLPNQKSVGGGVWALVAAILMMRKSLGDTYKIAIRRFFGILIGTIVATVFIIFNETSYIALSIGLFITISFCSWYKLEESTRIACTSVATVILFWKANSPTDISPLLFGSLRFIEGCIGMTIGVLVAAWVFPIKTRRIFETQAIEIIDLFNEACHLIGCHRISLEIAKEAPEERKLRFDLAQKLDDLLTQIKRHLFKLSRDFDIFVLEITVEEMRGKPSVLVEWRQLIGNFENMVQHFRKIKETYALLTELDDTLNSILDQVFTDFEIAFIKIHKTLEKGEFFGEEIQPEKNMSSLHNAIYSFYQKREVNSIDLMKNEELFFIFFYTIKELARDIETMDKNLKQLYSP